MFLIGGLFIWLVLTYIVAQSLTYALQIFMGNPSNEIVFFISALGSFFIIIFWYELWLVVRNNHNDSLGRVLNEMYKLRLTVKYKNERLSGISPSSVIRDKDGNTPIWVRKLDDHIDYLERQEGRNR